jgi:hypothetical protein
MEEPLPFISQEWATLVELNSRSDFAFLSTGIAFGLNGRGGGGIRGARAR